MNRKQQAEEAFAAVEKALRGILRWMYENPELGYQEFEASRRLSEFLSDQGFTVKHPAYVLETAFEATAGKSGPGSSICCEIDALPEVGHA